MYKLEVVVLKTPVFLTSSRFKNYGHELTLNLNLKIVRPDCQTYLEWLSILQVSFTLPRNQRSSNTKIKHPQTAQSTLRSALNFKGGTILDLKLRSYFCRVDPRAKTHTLWTLSNMVTRVEMGYSASHI